MRQLLAKMSLTQKLITMFLLVGSIPLAIGMGVAYRQFAQSLNANARQSLGVTATYKAKEIESYFTGLSLSLRDVAANPLSPTANGSSSMGGPAGRSKTRSRPSRTALSTSLLSARWRRRRPTSAPTNL